MRTVDFTPEVLRPFDTRHVPFPVPVPDVFDSPRVYLCVNGEWASHVDGVLERLLFRDAWSGTDEEIQRAIEQVRALLAALGGSGACAVLEDVRQQSGSPCTLEKKVNGQWVTFANLRLCPPKRYIYRYNTTTYVYERSEDDGTTWEDASEEDPRRTSQIYEPRTGGVDIKCEAADSIVTYIESLIDQISAGIDAAAALTALIGIIAAALIALNVPLAAPIAIELVAALLSLTSSGIAAAFTTAIYDDLRCVLYCAANDDGQFGDDEFNAVITGIDDNITGAPNVVFKLMAYVMGAVGLSNAGTLYPYSGTECDCPDCADTWCYQWDFTQGAGAWEGYAFPEPAVYVPGVGWRGGYVFVPGQYGGVYTNLRLAIPPGTTITRFEFLYDVEGSYDGTYSGTYVGAFVNGALVPLGYGQADPLGYDLVASWDGERADFEHVGFFSGIDSSVTTVTIRRAKVFGLGTNPFGADNCS